MLLDAPTLNLLKEADEDARNAAEEMISLITGLSEQARREGLLALEDGIGDLEDRFLAFALELVVDGTDPKDILDILLPAVLTEVSAPGVLLMRLVIITGVLAIQSGDNPRVAEQKMTAFLGASMLVHRWDVKQ